MRRLLAKAARWGTAACVASATAMGSLPAIAQQTAFVANGFAAATAAPAPILASARPIARPRAEPMPDLRWDHVRGSSRWTRAIMRAIDSHGQKLTQTVPDDIDAWCPAYPDASEWERKAFWAGLLSTLAKHESTYDPRAVGGGGLWYGLVQILPATARGYGCQARTGDALKDGVLNMSCAVRILNVTIPRDNVVARNWRGVAADWGPFHSRRKREDMRRWISSQPFCAGLPASPVPAPKPDWIAELDPGAWTEPEMIPLFVSWEMDKEFLLGPSAWSSAGSAVAREETFAPILLARD
ncbi:transglycosylase SLT domain-containing protein [Jannaschia sp. Os4]|uniref:transglycosylase SLT domain-containing protein n=1 Tax=Jannaschia sp. Os4 TaxID=2807617 RepID=UPI00193ABFAA|nr:transglycosylase SLT domain-containing protein [Jannaschia sp. Os4]MBM2577517.1 transglycosylase SLT domain-containing protein [Jannaschia sp. Os4]